MPTEANDNNEENSVRTCTYCHKKLTARWQHRKNGSEKYSDWSGRTMHGTCFKKNAIDNLAHIDTQAWLKEKSEHKAHELQCRLSSLSL